MTLSGKQRRHLRALAHSLGPAVQVGQRGITGGVVAQVEQALSDHELIKVKILKECPVTVVEAGEELSRATRCDLAGKIGHVLLLYRPHPETPRISLPKAPGKEN